MSFELFVAFILEEFGENAKVRNDRENGLFVARCGEWRVYLGHSSKRIRYYNVRRRKSYVAEI